jgi:hypothetical protein
LRKDFSGTVVDKPEVQTFGINAKVETNAKLPTFWDAMLAAAV